MQCCDQITTRATLSEQNYCRTQYRVSLLIATTSKMPAYHVHQNNSLDNSAMSLVTDNFSCIVKNELVIFLSFSA